MPEQSARCAPGLTGRWSWFLSATIRTQRIHVYLGTMKASPAQPAVRNSGGAYVWVANIDGEEFNVAEGDLYANRGIEPFS